MSKFDEALEKYTADMDKNLGMSPDADLLRAVAKGLGPSIYLKDASLVSCTDEEELDRVRKNFLDKKLGVTGGDADAAIKSVCEKYNTRNKHRAVFYYLLVKELGKESTFA